MIRQICAQEIDVHVVIVAPVVTPFDGMGSINYYTVERALARGHRVTLVTEAIHDDLVGRAGVTWIPIRVKHLPTDFVRSLTFSVVASRWITRHRDDIDVLHVNGSTTFVPADVNSSHFVYAEWLASDDLKTNALGPRTLYYRFLAWVNAILERRAYRSAEVCVAVSESVRAELVRIGVAPERISVIENGIDLVRFKPLPPNRERFGLPADVPLASFAGDLVSTRKNLDGVLDLLEDVPELHLAVAGYLDGSPYPGIVRDRGLSDRVHFLGYCANMPQLLASTDFFIFFSHYEPFGLVILESMAAGIPVVTSQNVGASAVVPDDAGIVLPARPTRSLVAETVRGLLRDPELRRAMGACGTRAAARYSFEAMADRYVDLYEAATPSAERIVDACSHQMRSHARRMDRSVEPF
jgi:glycosyltransferase involved in cell wall biosynthesis